MMFALPHMSDSVSVSIYEYGHSGSLSTTRGTARTVPYPEEDLVRYSRHSPEYGGAIPERCLTNFSRSRELCLTQGSDNGWSHCLSESKGDLIDPFSGVGP